MKTRNNFRLFVTVFLLGGIFLLTACNKEKTLTPELTAEEKISQHEKLIISKIEDFMPTQISSMFKDHFNSIRTESDYALYLDSIETSILELKSTIQSNFSLEDYKKALNNSLLYSQKKNSTDCLGIAYAKGAKIDVSLSGKVGAGIVGGLQAAGGGGVKTIYDFVNMERQVYYYSLCSYGYMLGIGAAAALNAGFGFSGINELITGIRYHGNSSGENSFDGQSLSTSYTLSSDLAVVVGIKISLGIGSSSTAVADFTGIDNLLPCPQNMVPIENGTIGYHFKVSGSLSVGAQTDIILALSNDRVGTNSRGAAYTYKKFSSRRPLAALNMSKEILYTGPLPGIISNLSGSDLAASAEVLLYGLKKFSSCSAYVPAIGTKSISNLTSNSVKSGGIVKLDGNSNITVRGVVWSKSENPTIINKIGITKDGQGIGDFTASITNLTANTTYYVRAYATNSVGTSYGRQLSFTTVSLVNNPPAIPSYPSPAIAATGVSTSPALSWSCTDPDGDALTFDVYFGTTTNPTSTIATNQTTFSINRTGLSNNTTYYWKIVAKDSKGATTPSPIWSFTTLTGTGTIPTNGLVAYYPFNGNANDASGSNNNGTVYGPTPTADRKGIANKAYLFDGIDDYIEINHSASLNLSQQISISFWAKLETDADYYMPYHIIEKYGCWGMGQRNSDVVWSVTTTNGDYGAFALNFEYGRYYHFVMIYDGSKISIYSNGVLNTSSNASGALIQNSSKVYISRYNFGGNYFFDGILDDFRIYNRALTQQEITALYNE